VAFLNVEMTAKPASSPRHSGPGSRDQDLDGMLARVAHWLPQQGPIKDFVHHNTLHAFQHLKFHDAARAAANFYGARSYMPLSYYTENFRAGVITELALDRALADAIANVTERIEFKKKMLAGDISEPHYGGDRT